MTWECGVESEVLAITESFYQAALEPETWGAALARMSRLFHGDQAYFTNGMTPTPFVAATGMSDTDLARFAAPEAMRLLAPYLNPHIGTLMPGKALVQERMWDDSEFVGSGFYNEIVKPAKTFYGSLIFDHSPEASISFSVCRARTHGHFTPEENLAMEQLFSHLRRALALHQRLRISDERAAGLTAVIERMEVAAIVLDAASRPLLVNASAARILDRHDGLTEVAGELQAVTPALTEQLRKAIAAAGVLALDHRQRLHLPRRGRLPLLLEVMPVWPLGIVEPGLRAPRVVVFIREPDAPVRVDQAALIETFGLTRRECEIVCLLAEGAGVDAIAARLGIQAGTVRQNLKHAFEKTQVHSQVELVALARSFGF
jgi:DNA-binding CsgD family transcriptional regulator